MSQTLMERLARLDAVEKRIQRLKGRLTPAYLPLLEQLSLDVRELKGNRAFADEARVERMEASVTALEPQNSDKSYAFPESFSEEAFALCRAVLAKAKEQNLAAAAAVCDGAGRQVALLAAEDAFLVSPTVAANKAYTSAALRMSTQEVGALTQPGGDFFGLGSQDPRIVSFGGGVPLIRNGVFAGALGVSGGSPQADHALAEYGAEIFLKGV